MQYPARFTRPLSDDFVTDGDMLIRLVESFVATPENGGQPLVLDEWQKWLLRHILERYPADYPDPELAGRLRYRQVVISQGRQNGKSTIAQCLTIYGLLMHELAPTVIGVASSVDQAKIVYSRALYSVTANPWLAKRFKKATEHRGIHLADGSGTYMVKAAKESALQGISVSLAVVDELHLIPEGLYSALTLGTSTKRDGIVIGITTAGDETSKTLLGLYETGAKAVAGSSEFERFGFFCWEAPIGCAVDDADAIRAANPAVECGRVPIDRVISDLRTLPEHEARRYRLNQFISGVSESWLPAELFRKAPTGGVTDMAGAVVALDVTHNLEHASLAVARKRDDGVVETELIASVNRPREDQLFNMVSDLFARGMVQAVGMDDYQLANLGKRFKEAGFPMYRLWSKEMASASSLIYSLFAAGSIQHNNDPLFIAQVGRGVARYTGESWRVSRRDSAGDIDALMSTIIAVYVANIRNADSIQVF